MSPTLKTTPLCNVEITLEEAAPIVLGRSPWRNRRVSYIMSGRFAGPRLNGEVRTGGGDWSELGAGADGEALTLVDVRSIWRTDDGALIYVAYVGRLTIPAATLPSFRDPGTVESLAEDSYYFRTALTFETEDARYFWLNRILAIGNGRRTARGVRYAVFTVD